MNHKEVINILELLESVFHVNSLYMHGIQIWPLLRREIWMHFLKQDKAPDLNQLYKLFNEIDSNDYNYKPRNLHNINQQHSGCSSIISTLNDKLYPANILFWSRYEEHSEEYEEGLIDRIIDP
ncbi:MAG: hypothetical protein GTO02_10975, partial [Candidatus Dadabacteria bacterium]|nr:hypothetical protein [Candidatus Dadabacteria bacterium]